MQSKVYFISARAEKFKYESGLMGKYEKLLEDFNFQNYIEKDAVIPIKIHLGNSGAFRTIRPQFVQKTVERLKKVPSKPFVTDSVRIEAYKYLEVANSAGYNYLTLGAPVVIADGMYGKDSIKVKSGPLLDEVSIASAIYDAESMVVLTHVKGHVQAVFGGAIKNISMGGVSGAPRGGSWKHGRGKMHFLHGDIMKWNKEKCVFCYNCVQICPEECIEFVDNVYTVDEKKCVRCGRCARVCPEDAIEVPITHVDFMKAVSEGAKAVLSTFNKKRVVYINFMLEMQPECDCMSIADTPVVQDQGILLSDDPVAIDKASLDMLKNIKTLPNSLAENIEVNGERDVFSILHGKNADKQLLEAEKMGLGSTSYELIKMA
ncbi:MAG: DUF362 domain-containing protein [Deferribacterota bacterium]|nr:DUF362 domain-containing protein [Deferribacterota bacterium]